MASTAYEATLLRLPVTLKAEVRKLARVNRRTVTEEMRIALEKHVDPGGGSDIVPPQKQQPFPPPQSKAPVPLNTPPLTDKPAVPRKA